jgi:N-formylglutamate deformylase
MFATFTHVGDSRVMATAIHHGHDLRPEVERMIAVDRTTRLREEDPHTGDLAERFGLSAVVHRSRFEVDLNRERERAVYSGPDDAWGLQLWLYPPGENLVAESLHLYDGFYSNLAMALDQMVDSHGGFVLYDIHAYNHRRQGPEGPPGDEMGNPTVNLGTGSMPGRWRPVADAFLEAMAAHDLQGQRIDARENVRFKGRAMAAFVHERYGDVGCALAIELKKVFMNEWTGELHPEIHDLLGEALLDTVDPVIEAWSSNGGK